MQGDMFPLREFQVWYHGQSTAAVLRDSRAGVLSEGVPMCLQWVTLGTGAAVWEGQKVKAAL